MSDTTPNNSTPGFVAQITSFNRVFWISNTMEMLERLAYYGLRTVLPIYMVLSVEEGGPQFDHIQKGWIYMWWAFFQSLLPVVTGGYADKYGYKNTVGVAIAIKTAGYLIMAYAIEIGAAYSGGANIGVPGHNATLWPFFVGAMLLAFGTAVFKPGIQAIIAHQLNEKNDSLGWSLFYQLVNVGGFLGPILAGFMRIMAWKWVFISCAVIVCLNYILLLTFEEPAHEETESTDGLPLGARISSGLKVLWHSLIGICEPRLMAFLVVFSGFWMMFHQLFDLLPNYIDDWVDSSNVLAVIAPAVSLLYGGVPEEWGGNVSQEWMINVNAGMCMFLAFLTGYATGKIRAMYAMIFGILLSSAAIFSLGVSVNGWLIVGAIALFSLGELSASPTKMRYFSAIAPPGKKGMYLGYINATGGIGWFIGSAIAGSMYEEGGDKVVLARRHLVDALGQNAETVAAMPKTEVLPLLAEQLSLSAFDTQMLLWNTYHPNEIWTFFATIGFVSMLALIAFDLVTRLNTQYEAAILTVLTFAVSFYSYNLVWATFFAACIVVYEIIRINAPQLLPQGAQES